MMMKVLSRLSSVCAHSGLSTRLQAPQISVISTITRQECVSLHRKTYRGSSETSDKVL